MPKLLIDENLSPHLAIFLRNLGYEASATRELQLKGSTDAEIISYAKKHHFTIITRDLGFGFVYTQAEVKFGVILLRSKEENREAFEAILSLLHQQGILKDERIKTNLVVAAAKKIRFYR